MDLTFTKWINHDKWINHLSRQIIIIGPGMVVFELMIVWGHLFFLNNTVITQKQNDKTKNKNLIYYLPWSILSQAT